MVGSEVVGLEAPSEPGDLWVDRQLPQRGCAARNSERIATLEVVDPAAFEERNGGCLVGRGNLPRVVADWERTWQENRWSSLLTSRVAGFAHALRQSAESLGLSWRPADLVEPISA